jgi:hypothetical protein
VGFIHGQKGIIMNTREKLKLLVEIERRNNERIRKHTSDSKKQAEKPPRKKEAKK